MYLVLILLSLLCSQAFLLGCKDYLSDECFECIEDLKLTEGLCLYACPSNYIDLGLECKVNSNLLFDINLEGFTQLQATEISSFSSPANASFANPSRDAPLLTLDRGFFFDESSSLISQNSWVPGPKFSLSFWVNVISPGAFISTSYHFGVYFDYSEMIIWTHLTFSKLFKKFSVSSLYSQETWTLFTIFVHQNRTFTHIDLSMKDTSNSFYVIGESRFDHTSYDWTIGKGFRGFLYRIQAANFFTKISKSYELVQCTYNQYWKNNLCLDCSENCQEWPWCISDSCEYCQDSCQKYRAYEHGRKLFTCLSNCNVCTADMTVGTCTTCATNYRNIQGVCIYNLPTGFDASNTQVNSEVIGLDFNNKISNTITASSGATLNLVFASGGSTSNFYKPSYDSNDPKATKERGYYFSSSAYMAFSSNSLIFAPFFTIYAWIMPIGSSGVIFSKQDTVVLTTRVEFSLDNLNLKIIASDITLTGTATTALALNTWYFVSVSMALSAEAQYSAQFTASSANEVASTSTVSFLDESDINSYINLGGKSPLVTNGYNGFLWKFGIYNIHNPDLSSISGLVAPISALISQFYDSTVQNCNLICATDGCVRADTICNLCNNPKCLTCDDFTTSTCLTCVTHASGAPTCSCDTTYYWLTESCEPCQANCDTCSAYSLGSCNACTTSFYLVQEICITKCPTGFSGASCDTQVEPALDISLSNIIKDSFYGFSTTITVHTGDSTLFYPNAGNFDPIPAKDRGYYFTGSSYMYLDANSFVFAPEHTIYGWINPENLDGIIFTKQHANADVLYTLEIGNWKLITYLDGIQYEHLDDLTPSSWNFIGVSYKLESDFKYTITMNVNGSPASTTELNERVFDDSISLFTVYIGSYYPAIDTPFYGFLYSLKIYNSLTPDLATLATTSPTFNYPISEYSTGTCNALCASKGCVRNDIKCNLCQDQQCLSCEDFTGSCLTCITNASGTSNCKCISGISWNTVTEACDIICTTNCEECLSTRYDDCTLCLTGYFLTQGVCVNSCPSGYTADSILRTCTLSSDSFILLQPTKIEDQVTSTGSSYTFSTGSSTSFYPSYVTGDPYAARYRGYYFTGSSYMYSSAAFNFSPQFTIAMWIRPHSTTGVIMAQQLSDDSSSLLFELSSGSPIITATLTSTRTLTGSLITNKAWNFVAIQGYIGNTPSYRLSIYLNSTWSNSTDLESSWYSFPSTTFLTLGAKRNSGSYSNYFTGFIYEFHIYNDLINPSTLITTTCTGGCTVCPTLGTCMYNCPIDYYWDGTKCTVCKISCLSLGCVRYDNSCNLCNDILCSVCTDFTSSIVCTTCKSPATLVANVCTCPSGMAYDSVTEECVACTVGCSTCTNINQASCTSCSSGYYLTSKTCLTFCPTGYTTSGTTCAVDSSGGYIFYIKPDKIENFVTDTQKSIKVDTGADSSFYPTYATTDPMASPRGYYFTGTSYMRLPPNAVDTGNSVTLSPVLTISMWIRYSQSGTIFIKQSQTSPYTSSIKAYLSGGYPSISVLLDNLGTKSTSSLSCSTALTTTEWHQFAFILTINGGTYLQCVIDGTSQSQIFIGYYVLIDYTSSYTITIGATAGSAFSSFFAGFLYSMKIWNYEEDPITEDNGSCSGCSYCPPGGCIENCPIEYYWDSGSSNCMPCKSVCAAKGCVREDNSCNLCSNQICKLCDDFTSCQTTGTPCISGASLSVALVCECDTGYYFDTTLESCTACPSSCTSCTSSSLSGCTSCTGTTYELFGLCRNICPSGYNYGTNTCDVGSTLILELTFDKIEGTITDTSPQGAVATGGSSSTFYPNYESNDPKAAMYRGYYFNGASSIINLPPYSAHATPLLFIAPKVTIDAWIFPVGNSGTIITKQDVSNFSPLFKLDLSSSILRFTANYDTLGVRTDSCSLSITLNQWNYIGFSLDYSSPSSSLTCHINGVSSSTTNLGSGFLSDTISSYKFLIGSQYSTSTTFSNYYTGFIYYISIDNSLQTPSFYSTTCTNNNPICPPTSLFLASCIISKYWTGPNHNDCADCNSNCASIGCVDSGASCTLCDDIICSSCTDYIAGTCTACKTHASNIANCQCDDGYYWNSVNEDCESCHSTCETCITYGFMECDTCKSGYVKLNDACHPYCPTGTSSDGAGGCTIINSPAFNLEPHKIEGVVYDKVGNIPVVTGVSSTFYPTLESTDPYPLQDRGLYFNGASYLILPPSTEYPTPVFLFGNTFVISAWIFHVTDGTLFTTQSSTFTSSIKIKVTAQPVIYVNLLDAGIVYSYTCQNALGTYWNFISFKIKLQSNGDTTAECTVNIASDSPTVLLNGYFVSSTAYAIVGALKATSTTYSNYWIGHLWSLKIYNNDATLVETTNVCVTTPFMCTLCPASTGSCINKCDHNTYWDSASCANCDASCQSCVRADTVCNLCYDEICYKCTDFTTGTCTQCKPNASLASGTCSCNMYYYWDTTLKSCTHCNSKCKECDGANYLNCLSCLAGYYWFYDLCLSTCPSGYTTNSITANCDMNYQKVLDLNFDTMSGQPADSSTSGILTRAGSTTTFFPNYETDDPYASYKRGYYFRGTSKVYMPPYTGNTLPLLVLAPDITIAFWIRPSGDGSIIYHQNNAAGVSLYFGINIVSSTPTVNIKLTNSGTVAVSTSTALSLDIWSHVAFTVEVLRTVGTDITCYLDGTQTNQVSYALDYFTGPTSNFLWIIGAKYSSTTAFTEFYTGYIYSITIWNYVFNTLTDWSLTTTCTDNPTACTVCPSSTGECMPDCGLTDYYDPSTKTCDLCKTSCTSGCRDATYCNLCQDFKCSTCSTFTSGSCSYCKANAAFVGSNCECNTLYIWYDEDEVCSMCYAGCSNCATPLHNDCITCSSGYYLTYSECLNFCPFGFTANSVAKTCTAPSDIYVFQLDFADKIEGQVTDNKHSFPIMSGSTLAFYPTYDSDDPLAADTRGYYFTGASFMDIQPASAGLLNFPSRLCLCLWVNYIADGTFLAKQNILDPNDKNLVFKVAAGILEIDIILTTGAFTANSVSLLNANVWSYACASVDVISDSLSADYGNTFVTFTIDDVSDTPQLLAVDYFMDLSTSFTFLIGSEYTALSTKGSFFEGFIWRISMWQDSNPSFTSEFTVTCSGCSICPSSGTCLSLCAKDQYVPDCNTCDTACTATITCIIDTTCNLCYDLLCEICNDYTSTGCTQCIEYANFLSGAGSACACDSGYSWNSDSETCDVCENLCAPCYDLQTTGCSGCISTAFFHDTVCMPWCPTGFLAGTTTCSGTSGLIFKISLLDIKGTITDTVTNNIKLLTGSSSTFYPTYESNDPHATQSRGYHFDGTTSYMSFVYNSDNNKQMVFSPISTVGMWIYPMAFGGMFLSKKTDTITDYLLFEMTSSGNLQLSVLLKLISGIYTKTSTQTVTLNSWNHIGYNLYINADNTEVIFYINGISETAQIIDAGHYEDLVSSYLFSLGADYTSTTVLQKFYKGYINEVKIWSMKYNLAQEVGGCSSCKCPASTGVCLSTCAFNQYEVTGTCFNCLASCTTSCVRSSDCNLCYDILCSSCQDFSATGCTACKTNANLITPANSCQCMDGTYFDSASISCISCFTYCNKCTSSKNGDCTACKSLSYMNPETGLCLTSCPVGYTIVGDVCSGTSTNSLAAHFKFTYLTNTMADVKGVYTAYMGSTSNFLGNFDTNDPYPIYSRGLYFKGTSYVALPPNSADVNSIILGNSHSISMWVRVKSGNPTHHYVMSKEDGTNVRAALYIDKTTMLTYAVYRLYSDTTNSGSVLTATGPAIPSFDSWCEIGVTLSRTGYSTELRAYLNGVSGLVSSLPNTFFHDVTSNTFRLGYSAVNSAYTLGFIYEIRVYNYVKAFSVPSTSCGCGGCTAEGICLYTCDYLYYFESTCKNCLVTCTTGCINGNNCNLSLDSLCSVAIGFEITQCTQCIPLASGAGNGCQCMPYSSYTASTGTCDCISGYTLFNNECVPCFYPLQATDLEGYFSEYYLSLIFNSTIAVQSTTSSQCDELFETSSYEMLGIDPSCKWSSDRMVLYVTLGTNATVTQSPITFKSKSLFTDTYMCGISPVSVTVNIDYKYPKPNIVPIAWLLAPIQSFIQCDDLSLDGSKSSNSFNRPLQYSWIFVSSPKVDVLSGYEDSNISNSKLFFTRSSLKASSVSVTMKVTNWLGYSASIKQNIEIIESKGLHLVIDGDTKWTMTTVDSKTIFIQATSSCDFSTMLSYSWDIVKSEGTYASVDKTALWKAQTVSSRIYVPAKVLKPGLYTFQVNVTDNANSMSGSTQFTITIITQDLVVQLPAEYLTVDMRSKIKVSGENCYDPDLLTGSLVYNWTCQDSTGASCTSLISDPIATVLEISSGLETGSLYNLNLTISKDTRSSWKVIIIKTVSFAVPTVIFSMQDALINSQFPITITADVEGVGDYTYLWSLEIGAAYSLSTGVDSTEIGFKANSLTQGAVYTFRFEITSGSQVAVYKVSFTVMKQPTGGSLKVTPSLGTEYSTIFKLEANDWIDASSPDSGILTYQFGFNLNNEAIILNIRNQSSFFYTYLPYSEQALVVWVRVLNSAGSYSLSTTTVSIIKNKNDLSSASYQDLSEHLTNDLSDPAELPVLISNIALYYFTNTSVAKTEKSSAFTIVISAIDKILSTTVSYQNQDIENILSVISVVTTNYQPDESDSIIARLYSVLNLATSADTIVDQAQVTYFTDILQQSTGLVTNFINTNSSIVNDVNRHLRNFLVAAAKSMVNGQVLAYSNDQIHISSVYYKNINITTYTSPSIPGYSGGITIDNILGITGKNIFIIFILYDDAGESLESISSMPTGVDFSLVEVTNSGNSTLVLELVDPVQISIPIYNYTDGIIECVYMIDDWNGYGCNLISFSKGMSTCSCNHTSLFSSGVGLIPYVPPPPDPKPPAEVDKSTWIIMFYYICGLMGTWMILSSILLIVDQNESSNRKRAEEAANNRFSKWYRSEDPVEKIKPEKKTNETITVDQNPTFFRKVHESPEIIATPKEKNPFLKSDPGENTSRALTPPSPSDKPIENADDKYLVPSKSSFTMNYYIAFIFFYDPYYSRFIRYLTLVTSLSIQNLLIGIGLYGFKDIYEVPGTLDLIEAVQFINYVGGLSALFVGVIGNLCAWGLQFMMKNTLNVRDAGQEAVKPRSRVWRVCGILCCLSTMGFVVFACYFMSNKMYTPQSIMWLVLVVLAVIVDILIVQSCKLVIYCIRMRKRSQSITPVTQFSTS